MLALVVTGVLVTLCTAVYAALRYRFTYWQRRKVVNVTPSVPFGNYTDTVLGKRNLSEVMRDMYLEHRSEPYIGTYFLHSPLLQIHDPEIIKQVFIKEFQDFNGRGTGDHSARESDPLSGHLFFLRGQPWRNMRVKLSPAFSSGKIKYMFETITECADFMREHMEASMKAGGGAYEEDMRELAARFSTDVISSVAFGIESNSMKNPDSEFRRMGQSVFAPTFNVMSRNLLLFFGSGFMSTLGIRCVPGPIHAFFTRIVDEMVTYRERNKVERADMLSLLIKLKNEGFLPPDSAADAKRTSTPEDLKKKMTMKEVMAQVFVFFVAGFETTSTTTSFTLLELAKHPDIQEKLREEIDAMLAKNGGQITYDAIMNLPYMEMVIQETLRMYPPVPFITREAMVERKLPLTDLTLEKNTQLMISILGLHSDPQYWPEPDRYDPQRFSEENKKTRPSAVYMPFGDGPRICIGMRLGLVQVKIAVATVLSKATLELAPGMPRTPRLSARTIVPTPLDGIRLVLKARN